MTQGIMKAGELAELLGCSVFTIEERARKRELPGLKFGDGGWVFPVIATLQVLNDAALRRISEPVQSGSPVAVAVEELPVKVARKPPALPSL